ncbi:hypothetical protein Nepgr_028408 [Nepenthes gracilis]|uniref:Uncharacterized protein n=1 Tax=Nepenthes gracilis TaxID=150966 RepID=A0AAD3Y3X5_NEPGR|nr:hypothetical protein Nepgr_028408 [Nepenthes gracilis]
MRQQFPKPAEGWLTGDEESLSLSQDPRNNRKPSLITPSLMHFSKRPQTLSHGINVVHQQQSEVHRFSRPINIGINNTGCASGASDSVLDPALQARSAKSVTASSVTLHPPPLLPTTTAWFISLLMVLVDDTGGEWPMITHAPWNGCNLVDFVLVLYGTYVPDKEFRVQNSYSADYEKHFNIICGVSGNLDPPCNAIEYVDRKVLGITHMYRHPAWRRSEACTSSSPYEGPIRPDAPSWCSAPYEPVGILRLMHWVSMGLTLFVLGMVFHFTHAISLNKQLYTFSYV